MGLDRDPPGLVQNHHEQGPAGEQVSRADDLTGRGVDRCGQGVRQVCGGNEGDGEDDEKDDRFGDGAEGLGATGAQLRVGRTGFSSCHRDDKGAQSEDEPAAQDVAHVPQGKWEGRQDGDEQGDRQVAGEGNERGRQEEPGGPMGGQRLLLEQLGQVVVRLQDPRAAPALQSRLHLGDETADPWGSHQDGEDLEHLDDDDRNGARHLKPPLPERRRSAAGVTGRGH